LMLKGTPQYRLAVRYRPGYRPTVPAPSYIALDHVQVGVADLAAGMRRLTALGGVAPARGCRQAESGTETALLSLGPHTYLELIAPLPGAAGDLARELASLREPTPIAWAVGTSRAEFAAAHLAVFNLHTGPFAPGACTSPDGRRLAWR